MTRDNLIQFLTETYEPNQELIWQTMCYEDVESADGATPELWEQFIEYLDVYNYLAEDFSENTFNGFYQFIEDETGKGE